jgi:hypothetical protein
MDIQVGDTDTILIGTHTAATAVRCGESAAIGDVAGIISCSLLPTAPRLTLPSNFAVFGVSREILPNVATGGIIVCGGLRNLLS